MAPNWSHVFSSKEVIYKMANEKIQFKRGASSNLPSDKTAGQILIETDTGAMYVDDSASSRIQIKDPTKAPISHTHPSSDLTTVVPVAKGGTSATDRATALHNLVKASALTDANGDETYDLNLYTEPGYWYFSGSNVCTNGPLLTHYAGYLFVVKGASTNVKQYYTLQSVAYDYQAETYVRTYSGGWSDWAKINCKTSSVGSDEANSNGWYIVASGTLSGYANTSLVFSVHSTGDYYSGILALLMRNDNSTTNTCKKLGWLVRNGFNEDDCCVVCDSSNKWTLYHKVNRSRYYKTVFEVISESGYGKVGNDNVYNTNPRYRMYNSTTKESTDPVATVISSDIGSVSNATTVNGLTVETAVPANAKFTDTTYSNATTSKAGLMSADDKTKLDGIATGANKTTVDSSLSSTSTNPVQNKVINTALSGKSDTSHTHTVVNGHTVESDVPSNAKFTDTHYTTHLYAGSGTAANAATSNGNTNITVVDNSTVRNSVTIKGVLGTDVSSDSSGIISIGNGIAKLNQVASVSSTEADNWQVVAGGEMTGNADINILFAVTDNFTHANGILSLGIRCSSNAAVTDQSANNGPRLEWINRHKDINPNHYRLRIRNMNSSGTATRCFWYLEAYHHRQNYTVSFEVIETSSNSGTNVPAYTLYTDGTAVATTGTTYVSRDVLPLGGEWDSSKYNTANATGITIGDYGKCTTATSGNIAIGGTGSRLTSATGSWAIAIGSSATSSGSNATAIGAIVTASGTCSVAIGRYALANAEGAVAIGDIVNYDNSTSNPVTAGKHSFATGAFACATATDAIAMGDQSRASGEGSVAVGTGASASQTFSYAFGKSIINNSNGAFACGRANKALTANTSSTNNTTGDVFVVGNGTFNDDNNTITRSNAFRVTYAGAVYAKAAYNSSGADYAEFVKEWYDGNPDNEDRVGYMVTIGEDNKLHKANEGDYIIGITSGNPSVIGNADEDYFWMYERDEFNRPICEEIDDFTIKCDENGDPVLDENGNQICEYTGEKVKRFKFKEGYDPSLQDSYIERAKRPEWDYVGMRGIVPVRDDGTCVARGFCKCGSDGIATYTSQQRFDTYYVIERISDNVVSVEVK